MSRQAARLMFLSLIILSACALAAPAMALAGHYGVENYDVTFSREDGSLANQAGSHPFQMTTTVEFTNEGEVPTGDLKDGYFTLPPGLVADRNAVPQCSLSDFLDQGPPPLVTHCANRTAIGYALTSLSPGGHQQNPIYNLTPGPGSILRFGYIVFNTPVLVEVGLNQESPFNGVAKTVNVPQTTGIIESILTLWGEPGESAHDAYRGSCASPSENAVPYRGQYPNPESYGTCTVTLGETPFLTLPRACTGPLASTFAVDSWQEPGMLGADRLPVLSDPSWAAGSILTRNFASPPAPTGMSGCERLAFGPTISAGPTTKAASSSSGLGFNLDVADEGLITRGGLASADIKEAVVTLPPGFTANPSMAEGLGACTEAQFAAEFSDSEPGQGCPDDSKLGTVEVETPLLSEPLNGAIYAAKPYENPSHSLLALYMVIKSRQLGITIRQPMEVRPDPSTGQLTAYARELPQLPFSHFRLKFREGPRAPLTTPSNCGSYQTSAVLTPWSGGEPVVSTSLFEVVSGSGAAACPTGNGPFAPTLSAGTLAPVAAAYSPFVLDLKRSAGESPLRSIEATLPAGLLAKLAGVQECSDQEIAAAAARSNPDEGVLERSAPSCPGASEIGTVNVGAGSGDLTFAQGKAYLAGPYKGAPLSMVVVTPAIAGPFDLGVVVIRNALHVDPTTARVRAVSDPIPTILQGIPLQIRSVAVNLTRPEFTLNPTSCEPTSIAGEAASLFGQLSILASRFQVGGCRGLDFKPKLALKLSGSTRRAGHPALKAALTYPKGGGYANIRRAQVNLPGAEFIDQSNIAKACTRPVLLEGKCPAKSIYGKAKAWTPLLDKPLKGNVYLVGGYGYTLPALVADLGGQIRVLLVGKIDSGPNRGIRTTFESAPDAPVEKFVLEMKGGKKYGLLENSENLCARHQSALARFVGQNGAVESLRPAVQNSCKKK